MKTSSFLLATLKRSGRSGTSCKPFWWLSKHLSPRVKKEHLHTLPSSACWWPRPAPGEGSLGQGTAGDPEGPRVPVAEVPPSSLLLRARSPAPQTPPAGGFVQKKKKKNLQCNLCSNLRTPFSDFNCVTVFWYFQYPVVG